MRTASMRRAELLGHFIADKNSTVRDAAKEFNISKSTVHKDVTVVLRDENPVLYKRVRRVLDQNKAERHIRGGMATKKKYMNDKKVSK